MKSTLDEKRAQIENYRFAFKQLIDQENSVVNLQNDILLIPITNKMIRDRFDNLLIIRQTLIMKLSEWIKKYENYVQNHQDYSKLVLNCQDWFNSILHNIDLWSDTNIDRISLASNMEKLTVNL